MQKKTGSRPHCIKSIYLSIKIYLEDQVEALDLRVILVQNVIVVPGFSPVVEDAPGNPNREDLIDCK